MRSIRLAVATRCFHQSLTDSLKSATDLGYTGIQLDIRNELRSSELTETGRRDFLHRLGELGLSISSAVFPMNHPIYEQDKLDIRLAAIRDAMRFAYSIRANTLCLRIGHIPSDESSKERQLLLEVLSDLCRDANHIGTSLAITSASEATRELRSIVDSVKTGPIGVDFDPASYAMSRQPVAEALRGLHGLVLHVQLRDGSSGMEAGQEETVGRGNVDWIELLALLGEMDYRGWLTAIREKGVDQVADLARAIKYVNGILLGSKL